MMKLAKIALAAAVAALAMTACRTAPPARVAAPVVAGSIAPAPRPEEQRFPAIRHEGFLPLTIEGQDARMAYTIYQPPVSKMNRAVLLLHGKNFDGDYWQSVAEELTTHDYWVIVPEQIGFGKSTMANVAYSFDMLAENTKKLVDTLPMEKVDIVGHSMGGMLAVRFALKYPKQTGKLILEDPIGLEDYRLSIPKQSFTEAYTEELNKSTEAFRKYVQGYFVTWKPEYESIVQKRVAAMQAPNFPDWAKASARTSLMIYNQPVRQDFPKITEPTLLIIGLEDRTVVGKNRAPADVKDKLGNYPVLGPAAAKDIPNAKLIELPNVGHIPHLEAPGQFMTALLDFLRE